ncbi:hypothetical protein [Hongsoonwoonella zoysiae]|uniref:hypothetical protein n=1 Tax=Hongsoonwoonella zoysiae TaxID=2821844 RepID=UPI001FE81827|nr:hypothetical protein [Hongsoonwoonella zoysiae]
MKRAYTMLSATAMAFIVSITSAYAARPDTRAMTCRQAQSLVERYGAVVMTTGKYTYFRFVSQRNYCDPWEVLRPKVAPTRDNPACIVGYACVEPLFAPWDD